MISKQEINQQVSVLADKISKDYKGQDPLFIIILNGSFIFAADLLRALTIPAEMSFVKLSSYSGMQSSDSVLTDIGLKENPEGRHIVIVEDIVDTGKTLFSFLPELQKHRPASIKIAALLCKPEALTCDIKADYVCFEIPNKFVVGYGLDYNGMGRNLPDIYELAQ
jgi:hypoxanthine phosphoribosyltransferase